VTEPLPIKIMYGIDSIMETEKTVAGACGTFEFLVRVHPELEPLMIRNLWDLVEKYIGLLNEGKRP
jgi:hypothetical protein